MEITIYHRRHYNYHESLEHFRENLLHGELRYFASDLADYGLTEPQELEDAMKRAMQVCETMSVPSKNHFRPVYSFKDGAITADWRLSALGRKLVILNAGPSNPYVAMLQMRLLSKLSDNF